MNKTSEYVAYKKPKIEEEQLIIYSDNNEGSRSSLPLLAEPYR